MKSVKLKEMLAKLEEEYLDVRLSIRECEVLLKRISNDPEAQGPGYDDMELRAGFSLFGDKRTGTRGLYDDRKELSEKICAIKLALFYEDLYGEEVSDRLFSPEVLKYLGTALGIILNNQAGIGADSFIKALSGSETESVIFDKENNCIVIKGENDGLPYDIKIFLTADGIRIENKCELYKYFEGKKVHLVCDIPETITPEAISKDEVTIFEMPDNIRERGELRSFFGLLVYTNEESSAKRAVGKNITEDDIIKLVEEKRVAEGEHGHISYNPEKCSLEIESEDRGTQTHKTYELQFSEKGVAVVYRKKENTTFENSKENKV